MLKNTILTLLGVFAFCFLIGFMKLTDDQCRIENEKKIFRDLDCVIIGSNEGVGETNDKYHKPCTVYKYLVRNSRDTTLYMEMSSLSRGIERISRDLWYSKGVGDTLHFIWIQKYHFFKIKR